jgi:UDP-N-acetylmuramoyl-tripeptide--D-alanyl-D-alanine ligase
MDRLPIDKLLKTTGGEAIGFAGHASEFARISIDSRTVEPGDLFWALRGERYDAHDFVQDAIDRGASAVVVEQQRAVNISMRTIAVEDTQTALWDLARSYRQDQQARVIGVTGSVGKTTTREMIHAVLDGSLASVRSRKNFNNHVGLPLSILDIETHHEAAILEMGASRPGEIRGLAGVAQPDIGVITKVGSAHLKGFVSDNGILAEKLALIESLPSDGLAVLPGDDFRVRDAVGPVTCRKSFFGETPGCDVLATHVEATHDRLRFRVWNFEYTLPVASRHFLTSALAAIAVAREFGISDKTTCQRLASFESVIGRCSVQRIGTWTIIDDSYNASPDSMAAACDLLRGWKGQGRRVFVAGDMLELGEASGRLHFELGQSVAESGIEHLVVCGRFANSVADGAITFGMPTSAVESHGDVSSVIDALQNRLLPHDVLLVKGSRGMQMERIIQALRTHAGRELSVCHP